MRKLYTLQDLRARNILYSNSQLHRLERAGKFPRRLPIGGGKALLWDAAEIEGHIEEAVLRRTCVPVR